MKLLPVDTPINSTGSRCGWEIGTSDEGVSVMFALFGDTLLIFANEDGRDVWEDAYRMPRPDRVGQYFPDSETRDWLF